MEVEGIWFKHLVSGLKPVEGRKKSAKWEKLKVGQVLEVRCKETQEVRLFKISHINEYNNVVDYLIGEGLNRCLPGVNSIEEGVTIYQQWSTPQELEQYKFLAIGMSVI